MSNALTHFENCLLLQLGRIADSLDRNTIAIANGTKPMLTDAEAAARLGVRPDTDATRFMRRLRDAGLLTSIAGGHHVLWSASQIDEKVTHAHLHQIDFTPSSAEAEAKPTRKPRSDVAA